MVLLIPLKDMVFGKSLRQTGQVYSSQLVMVARCDSEHGAVL
jgi:hypothetical protein